MNFKLGRVREERDGWLARLMIFPLKRWQPERERDKRWREKKCPLSGNGAISEWSQTSEAFKMDKNVGTSKNKALCHCLMSVIYYITCTLVAQ